MKKKKVMIANVLCLIISLGLFSCGNSSSSQNTSIGNTTNTITTNTITTNTTIVETFSFSIVTSEGGSVSGTTNGDYEFNTVINLIATSSEGYFFEGFFEDDILVSLNYNYSFQLTKDCNIRASFLKKPAYEDYYIATYKHIFKKDDFTTVGGVTSNINGLVWNYTASTYLAGASQGLQIGSASRPQRDAWEISANLANGITLTSYYVELCNAKEGSAEYTISFGEYTKTDTFAHDELTKYEEKDLNIAGNSFKLSLKSVHKAMYFYSLSFQLLVPINVSLPIHEDIINAEPVVPGEKDIPATTYQLTSLSEYYANINISQENNNLLVELRTLISSMTQRTYGDAKTMLQYTDENPNKKGYLYGLYDGDDIYATWDSGASWNREHVWACAQMKLDGTDPRPGESTRNIGTDLHNLRVACPLANGKHSNKFYDEENSSNTLFPNITSGLSGYHNFNGDFRGDVARVLFYMYVRYEGLKLIDDLSTGDEVSMGRLSLLLKWNQEDSVDEFELQRNNRIYEYQGNRNPFIDYPQIASYIF